MKAVLEFIKGIIDAWKRDTDRINEYNRAVCLQRDQEYQQYLIWRGIIK